MSQSYSSAYSVAAAARKPPRTQRKTYKHDAVVAEFKRLTEYQQEHPEFVIMIIDMSRTLGIPHTTIRRVLNAEGLWTPEHHARANSEKWHRINRSRAANGQRSLRRQAELGYPNLQAGREKLAQIRKATAEWQVAADALEKPTADA